MEASTLQAPAGLARHRVAIGIPLLRLRSDDQLVALFRAGHDEAFRVIHDRYEKRLLAYTRQMLPRGQDAEDALQDVFVRAYSGLRTSNRELALRAWLFRVAHNRCIDELRRPRPPAPEVLQLTSRTVQDPVAEADRRESLRRLIVDVRRLPDQQRSALLMREMGGMSYSELAGTLGVSVPAIKSLLVRARLALAQAAEARDTACSQIREELVGARDRGVRPNSTAKRHMRDCAGCRSFRRELRAVNRRLAALAPLGPLALLAKAFGLSSSAGAGSGATASGAGGATAGSATATGGAAAFGGAASGGGVVASGAIVVGSGHVATLLAAAVATAGGAVAISAPPAHPKAALPAAKVQNANALVTQLGRIAAVTAAAPQDAAAAVGAQLAAQTTVTAASPATRARRPKPIRRAPTASRTPATRAPTASSAVTPPLTGSTVTSALQGGGTDPTTTTTPTSTGSTGSSTGSSQQGASSTDGSSPSGAQTSSGSSSGTGSPGTGGSTASSSSGAGGGSGSTGSGSGATSGGSTDSTGTSPDPGSGTGTSTSPTGSTTPSK